MSMGFAQERRTNTQRVADWCASLCADGVIEQPSDNAQPADTSLSGTHEDMRRHGAKEAEASMADDRQQVFRRAALLSVLCLALLQYYFFTIGLEIVSMSHLTVFIPPMPNPV
jgi:hypothetical protein